MSFDIVPAGAEGSRNIGSLSWTQFFGGIIDEMRVYNQALSAAEIQKHFAEGLKNRQPLVQLD